MSPFNYSYQSFSSIKNYVQNIFSLKKKITSFVVGPAGDNLLCVLCILYRFIGHTTDFHENNTGFGVGQTGALNCSCLNNLSFLSLTCLNNLSFLKLIFLICKVKIGCY